MSNKIEFSKRKLISELLTHKVSFKIVVENIVEFNCILDEISCLNRLPVGMGVCNLYVFYHGDINKILYTRDKDYFDQHYFDEFDLKEEPKIKKYNSQAEILQDILDGNEVISELSSNEYLLKDNGIVYRINSSTYATCASTFSDYRNYYREL